jgi:hypothetical protein
MVTQDCPWCEVDIRVDPSEAQAPEMACPECSTSWLTVHVAADELALAA